MSHSPVEKNSVEDGTSNSAAAMHSAEPSLAPELRDAFGAWLEPQLEQLALRFADYVTDDSQHKALFQNRSSKSALAD